MNNVAGSGARWLDVSAERFPGWISSFARRHGDPRAATRWQLGSRRPTGPWHSRRRTARSRNATRRSRNRLRCRPGSPTRTRSPRRSPRTPGRRAPSASSWSASAGTRPGCSPATRRRSPTRRSGPAWCTAAARRAAGRSTASPAAGKSRRTRRLTRRRTRRVAVFGRGPRLDAVVLGGDKRAVAGAARRPEARPVPGPRDGAVPHRPRPEARRPRGHAEAVHRGADKAYRAFIGGPGVVPRTIPSLYPAGTAGSSPRAITAPSA